MRHLCLIEKKENKKTTSNVSHKLFNFLLSREKQRLKSGVSETGMLWK